MPQKSDESPVVMILALAWALGEVGLGVLGIVLCGWLITEGYKLPWFGVVGGLFFVMHGLAIFITGISEFFKAKHSWLFWVYLVLGLAYATFFLGKLLDWWP